MLYSNDTHIYTERTTSEECKDNIINDTGHVRIEKKKTKMLEINMYSETISRISDSYSESYTYKISWIDNRSESDISRSYEIHLQKISFFRRIRKK